MPRIICTEAICLAAERYRETSKRIVMFSAESGLLRLVAKGARRPKNKFGAALERFSASRISFYWHEHRSVFTLSSAELLCSHSGITLLPDRYLAAEQIIEFILRVGRPHDPRYDRWQETTLKLYKLTRAYLAAVEQAETGFSQLVASFILKATSFLGFRPELDRCVLCRRQPQEPFTWFDLQKGGIVCLHCLPAETFSSSFSHSSASSIRETQLRYPLPQQERQTLLTLLKQKASELRIAGPELLPLVLAYASWHLDSLTLHSFRWQRL